MAIEVSNLHKIGNNRWVYEYDFTNIYQDPIDSHFFTILKFEPNYLLHQREIHIVSWDCDFRNSDLYNVLMDSYSCVSELKVSISDSFRFSQRHYLHERGDYTYFSYNIYQDAMQIGISVGGKLGNCVVDPLPWDIFWDQLKDYIVAKNIIDETYVQYYSKIDDANIFDLVIPSFNVPIVNEAFGKWSVNYKVTAIPKSFR